LGIETIIHWRIDGKRRRGLAKDYRRPTKISFERCKKDRDNFVNRSAQITMEKPKMPKPKREREREFKMENNGPVRNFYASENQIKIT
jgi:hypothetical protein